MPKNLIPAVRQAAATDMRSYFAEFLGAFVLIFCGTGAIVIDGITGQVGGLGIAFTFGGIVMALIYALGPVSGAHFNPAVTLAFALAGRFPWRRVVPYILSQAAGACTASFLLYFMFPAHGSLGVTLPHSDPLQSFLLETVLSFILMLVILQVATGSREQGLMAGLAIGGVVGLEAAFAGPISGASMNPARSLAPALVTGHTQHLWIYLAGPILGMFLSVAAWHILSDPLNQNKPSRP